MEKFVRPETSRTIVENNFSGKDINRAIPMTFLVLERLCELAEEEKQI